MAIKTKFDKAVIIIVITILFYSAILFLANINSIIEKTYDIDFLYVPPILSLMGVHTIIMAIRFHRLLQRLEIRIPFKESLKIFVAGLSLSITPGGIGTAIKSHILQKRYGKSISSSLPIILIERWTELLAILIITTVLLLWADLYESIILMAIGYVLILIIMTIFSNSKIFLSFKGLITKINYFKRFAASIDESKNSLNKLTKKESLLEALGLSLVAKSLHLITVYLVFLSVGINLSFFESGQVYYTSLIFGVLTFIPAGIVVTESSMLGLLLKYGVEIPVAVLAVIYVRIVSMWLVTLIGALTLKFVFREKEKSNT